MFATRWKVHIMSFRNFSIGHANSVKKPAANPAAIDPSKTAKSPPATSADLAKPAPNQGAND